MSVIAANSFESAPQPEIRTAAGVLRGSREAGLAVFRGVPYAEPPVGALRFAAPRPVRGWAGARAAASFGPPPPQPGFAGIDEPTRDVAGDDWLSVNVWSPDPDQGAGLPVLVWIPGGAYMIGASSLPEFDGGRLAAGGAVVVTLNYRLGAEGFAQIDGAPANRGLLDQVAALQWVRENIRAFGGDPRPGDGLRRVRGSRIGRRPVGHATGCRALPPRRRTERAGAVLSVELAADVAAACAAELGLRPTAADLSAVDPSRLSDAGVAVSAKMDGRRDRWGLITHRKMPFGPVVDGDVLPATPWQALAAGAGREVDLLVGHTRDEHRLFSLIDGVLGQVTEEQAERDLVTLAPGPDGARRYREAFPNAGPEELYELVNGDWLFRMPTLHLAQAHAAAGGRTFLYELTWAAPGVGGALGACHGLDIPLVFGNLSSGQPGMLIGDPSAEAEALSARMRGAWTAFAADGDPGWPEYDADQRLVQLFDSRPAVTGYPEEASRLLWQQHTFPALPLIDE